MMLAVQGANSTCRASSGLCDGRDIFFVAPRDSHLSHAERRMPAEAVEFGEEEQTPSPKSPPAPHPPTLP